MKQRLLFMAASLLFFSCDKDNDSKLNPTQATLMAHTWIEDSVGSTKPEVTVAVPNEPKYEVEFKAERFYSRVGIDGPIYDSLRYEMEDLHKAYYWADTAQKSTDRYFTVITLTDTLLVLSYPNLNQNIEYYHAR